MVEDALQSLIPTRFWRCGGPYFVYGEDTYLSSSTLLAELNRIDKDIAVQEKKKAGYDKKASDLDKKIIDTKEELKRELNIDDFEKK